VRSHLYVTEKLRKHLWDINGGDGTPPTPHSGYVGGTLKQLQGMLEKAPQTKSWLWRLLNAKDPTPNHVALGLVKIAEGNLELTDGEAFKKLSKWFDMRSSEV